MSYYYDVRDSICTGDIIGFAHHSNWLLDDKASFQSYCIRWGTQPSWLPWRLAEVSHVGIAVWDEIPGVPESRQLVVLEAIGSGIREVRLSNLLQTYYGPIYWKPYLRDNGIDVAKLARERTGMRYPSLTQYAIIAAPWLRRLMHWNGWSTDVDDAAYCCSEFVAAEYLDNGYIEPEGRLACECAPIVVWSWPIFGAKTELEITNHAALRHSAGRRFQVRRRFEQLGRSRDDASTRTKDRVETLLYGDFRERCMRNDDVPMAVRRGRLSSKNSSNRYTGRGRRLVDR